jgi:8-oxo-dGTP diphosphatase
MTVTTTTTTAVTTTTAATTTIATTTTVITMTVGGVTTRTVTGTVTAGTATKNLTDHPALELAAAILRRDDSVLLCHRHPEREWYPNVWDVPGGHVEPGETPADALVRELREELGVDLSDPLGPAFTTVTDLELGMEMTIWVVDYDGEVANRAPDEHDEIRWVPFADVADLVLAHPSYVDLFRRAARA